MYVAYLRCAAPKRILQWRGSLRIFLSCPCSSQFSSPLSCLPLAHAALRFCVCVRLQYGCTPLHKAAEVGHVAVASLLLDKGADMDAKTLVRGGVRGLALVPFHPLHEVTCGVHLRLSARMREV